MIFWNFRQYGAKACVLSFPEEGDGQTHARRNNQLRAQPSEEMHENKLKLGVSKSYRDWNESQEQERGERKVREGRQSDERE